MRLGIIGFGPAGVMSAIQILENTDCEIVFFDDKIPLATLLPTGGGRCNLAFAEFDNSELVKFYPRGEKFLYSVFSAFSTGDTLDFFNKIGVPTYIQEDNRIFPTSNSAEDVREKLLAQIKTAKFIKEKVFDIKKCEKTFIINNNYEFDKIIFAGGIKNNAELLKCLGIKVVEPKPSLCAICAEDKTLYSLAGVTVKNVSATFNKKNSVYGDLLFTHNAISGPLAYKISSYCAYEKYPYLVYLNFVDKGTEVFCDELIEVLDKNAKKNIVNIVSEYIPHSFAEYLLQKCAIDKNLKANQISRGMREKISELLTNFEIKIVSQKPDGEIVTAGGVDLDFINPKTMEYKPIPSLYFCGEVLNIDGLTGGFNLQNCWSTGYIAGSAVSGLKNLRYN